MGWDREHPIRQPRAVVWAQLTSRRSAHVTCHTCWGTPALFIVVPRRPPAGRGDGTSAPSAATLLPGRRRVLYPTDQPGSGIALGTQRQLSPSPRDTSLGGGPVIFDSSVHTYPPFPGIALAPEALASSNLLEQNQIPSQLQKAMK